MATKYFKAGWSGNLTKRANQALTTEDVWSNPVAVGDFNADGHQDIFLSYYENHIGQDVAGPTNGRAVLLLGDGKGNFVDGSSSLPGGGIFNHVFRKLAEGDFNGDGQDDIAVVTNREDGRNITDPETNAAPQILLTSGGGHLSVVDLGMTVWGHNFAAGDINNDGLDDLILGGFTTPAGAPSGTAQFFQLADGTMSGPHYMLDFPGISSAIGDFDGDGKAELADFWVDNSDPLQPYGLRLTQLSDTGERLTSEVILERPVRIEHGQGWNGPADFSIMIDSAGNEFVDGAWNDTKVADLNGDGKDDIVAIRFGFQMNYVDGVLTQSGSGPHNEFNFYSQGEGGLVRSPDITIEGWTQARFDVMDYRLLDWNGDGHIDLFVKWTYDMPDDPGTGAHVFLNDGVGHLTRLKQNLLPNARDTYGNYNKTLDPIDANGDGIMDLLVRPDGTGKSWTVYEDYSETLFLGTKQFYTGPGHTNPALKGAPGFNEQYYLHQYADAAATVKNGKYDSGLEHFLEKGQAKGYLGFAAGTHIYGSDVADTIKAREGEERLDGGLGEDTLTGRAGADEFVFSTKLGPTNVDIIKDFKPGQDDIIALDRDIFRKVGTVLDDKEFFAKKGAVKAHDRDDRIIYDTKTGKVFYDADGSKKGGHDAVHFATLANKALIDHGDFVIV